MKGYTLLELSERSHVSRSMLSQIERDEKNPTINVLCQIAEALDTTVSHMIGEEEEKEVVLIRKEELQQISDQITGCKRTLLSPAFPSKGIEFLLYTIPQGKSTGTFPAHQHGVKEYLHLVEGSLQITLGERRSYRLEPGDSFYFEANLLHRMDNVGDGDCVYYLVIDSNLRQQ